MKFKEKKLEQEFWQLTPKARWLASYVDYILWQDSKKEATITCIFYEGGSGIHSQWRAFDIRSTDLTVKEITRLKDWINYDVPYDVDRPNLKTCIHHKVSAKKIKEYKLKNFVPQYHLHFQAWIK